MKEKTCHSIISIESINERVKKLEDIIYGNKLYVKCTNCNGHPNTLCTPCRICDNGYIEVKIKDDGK